MSRIDRIHEKIDIEQVARHLDLLDGMKRTGGVWKGLCPFHNEKTPSFTITPDRGTFHCFGCGAHGDAIDLYAEIKQLQVPDALPEIEQMLEIQPMEYQPLKSYRRKRSNVMEAPPKKYAYPEWRVEASNATWNNKKLMEWAKERGWGAGIFEGLSIHGQDAGWGIHGLHPTVGPCLFFLFERGIKCRPDLNRSGSCFWVYGDARHCAWRVEQADGQSIDSVVIFEGETDCLSYLNYFGQEEGVAAIAQPGASWIPAADLAFRIGEGRHIYLCGDKDQAGWESNQRLAQHFRSECKPESVRYFDWNLYPQAPTKSDASDFFGREKLRNKFWTSFRNCD